MTTDSQIQVLLLHRCDVIVFRLLKAHVVHNYYIDLQIPRNQA